MHTNDPSNQVEQHRPPSHVDEFGNPKPVPHPAPKFDADHPGYETTDVNTNGVIVFLAGLSASVVVFFFLCFGIGKALNYGNQRQDAEEGHRNPVPVNASGSPAQPNKRENLVNNPIMEQQESARIARSFPTPRLDADDGDQGTADMHAKEDLLLEHNSVDKNGEVRIPIERAMELIAQRGLPSPATPQAATPMAGERTIAVHAPLTNGFARTAYEIEQIQSREQKMMLEHGAGERASAEHK
ncbi:MAG: hypothetical protein JSS87_09800 [Acidobacteria bacterium]|nr:hypothetical protein [Acidobacteriota bacterium]